MTLQDSALDLLQKALVQMHHLKQKRRQSPQVPCGVAVLHTVTGI